MGGGKETPRQKMVGLMYLVLMALLAMNVSKEVINAFVTLNDKIDRGNDIIKGSMDGAYGSFEAAIAGLKAQKAGPDEIAAVEKIQKQAMSVQAWSKGMTNYFVEQSSMLIKESGDASFGIRHVGDAPEDKHFYEDDDGYYHMFPIGHLSKKDDYDVATRMYIGDGGFAAPKGTFIVDSITNYRDRICKLIANYTDDKGKTWEFTPPEDAKIDIENDPASIAKFNSILREAMVGKVNPADTSLLIQLYSILTPPELTDNHGEKYPWIGKQFDHAPLVAAISMFTSIRSDILQAENKAVTHISSRVKAPKFNFNKIVPLAFSKSSYINQGDSVGLKVMIAAYDSTEAMELQYWEDDSTKSGDGKTFKGNAGQEVSFSGGVGAHRVDGLIAVKEKGQKKWKPWKFNYSVGAPNAAVAAADLAVLYKNWDNKIKVSASGFDPASVKVSCSGCSISKSGDFYIAKAGKGKEATISVSATGDDGKTVKLTDEKFRIFPLPTPKPYFAGQTFDKPTMKKGTAGNATMIKAKLGDSPLDVPYKVTGFKMIVSKNGKIMELKSKGEKLTGEMKNAIKKTPKGGLITFTGINAKGPTGKAKPIGGLSFKLL